MAFERLLGPLCDIQVVTGAAICIAGLSQLRTITFYHEQLVINYWWLTMSSFWASRVQYRDWDAKMDHVRDTVRRFSVLISVVLGVIFQFLIMYREGQDWDPLVSGRCYIAHDKPSNYLWAVGLCLYAVVLILVILPRTRFLVDKWTMLLRTWLRSLLQWHKAEAKDLKAPHFSRCHRVAHSLFFVLSGLCLISFWAGTQFIAIWSYGDGRLPVLLLVYAGFAAQNTYDIIDLKVSNYYLLSASELEWGFGQVLPISLLAVMVFHTIDAFRGRCCLTKNRCQLNGA